MSPRSRLLFYTVVLFDMISVIWRGEASSTWVKKVAKLLYEGIDVCVDDTRDDSVYVLYALGILCYRIRVECAFVVVSVTDLLLAILLYSLLVKVLVSMHEQC